MHGHLVSCQSLFIPQFLFRVTNISNRTSIKYPGTTTSTSKIHINNMYIKYTFLLDVVILQICQVFGVVTLPVTIALAVETLSVRLRTSFGLLRRRAAFLPPFLKLPFLGLPCFLKLVVLLTINTWCSFLISTSAVLRERSSGSIFFMHCILQFITKFL